MKLVIAIVHDEDSHVLINELNKAEFSVTRLASTGGFLKAGNTTLLIGAKSEDVESIIEIIRNTCKTRKEIVTANPFMGEAGAFMNIPIEVNIGGATVFVLDVEKFEKC